MCDPQPSNKGSVGAAVVLGVGAVSVVAYAIHPTTAAAPKPAPVEAAPVASSGVPWLTISVTVLATLAAATLIVVAVRAWRRRRVPAPGVQAPQRAITQRLAQRALPSRETAQAWLDRSESR